MAYKTFSDIYKSYDYNKKFKIQLDEDELFALSDLFNPGNIARLFGVIRTNNEKKKPKADAKVHVTIEYYTNRVESKYSIIKNQLSIALLYTHISNATMVKENLYEVTLNPVLLAELEYSVSHDVLRKFQYIDEIKAELDETTAENYREECNENISNEKRIVELYENILIQIDKTIGKDGLFLIQNDMAECELEGLNGLILHREACKK